jgi:DNA-binding MurR/RpiR family transcriptional regulator
MVGDSKTLYELIRALPRLTASEAKIVAFIQRAHSRLAFEKVTSIAQKAGVGKASVVRFIARLGFASFNDFQKCLQEELQERLEKPLERFLQRQGPAKPGQADLLGRAITQVVKNLQEAHARIKPEQFEEAVRLLALSEGTVYVAGNLTSFGLAYYFWVYAHYLRERVTRLNNLGSDLPCQLLDVQAQDVLFVVTHHLYSRQTQLIVEYFAQRGGAIIMLSDAEVNPFSQDRKSTRLNSSHNSESRMPSSA